MRKDKMQETINEWPNFHYYVTNERGRPAHATRDHRWTFLQGCDTPYTDLLWHARQLRCAGKLRNPTDSLAGVQFYGWFGIVKCLHIIHDANLDDLGVWKGRSVSEERRSTVT